MDQQGDGGAIWTGDRVEARLIAAFRAVPHHVVFSRAGRVHVPGESAATEALNWPSTFVTNDRDRQMLLTWARCKATGAPSFAVICQEMSWSRPTAERGRRRAANTIVAALMAEAKFALDSEKGRPGLSANA